MKRSKRYQEFASKLDKTQNYPIEEAIKLIKETSKAKFDPTIEIHFRLGIDPKQSDQQIRSSITLPHGTGKTIKILAIVPEDKVKDAKEAQADQVGSEELIEKIAKTKKVDCDIVITTPEMMKSMAKIAKVLGPKGLMPNPKTETVTPKIKEKIQEFKKGRLNFRNDDTGNIHIIIGKASFDDNNLIDNFNAFVDNLKKIKPSGIKGIYIKNVSISSTMGPSLRVKI